MERKNFNSNEATKLRRNAEERLKEQKTERSLPISGADALKLIHELEVHQIELEMQNEELAIAINNTAQANEKYKELYDFAPSGYLSISKEGDILELNFAAALMLGKERSDLINNRFALFISQETLADFNLFVQKVFTSKTKQTCEVIIDIESHSTLAVPIDVNIVGLISPNEEYCLLTLADISERKQAEQALKESEEKTRLILKHNPNAIAVFDNQMNLLIVSDRFLADYNVKDKSIIGKNHYEVFPEMPEKWRNVHKKALQGEVLSSDDDYFIRPDGRITYTRWECRPWYHSDNSIGGMIAYTEVITERKLAEIALKESERNLQLKNYEYEAINEELLQTNNELLKAKEKAERNEIELIKAQEIAHVGSWYLDIETNEVMWTEELYKMYGFDPTQPVPPYTEHMKLFTTESWEILSTSLAKTRETGIPYELELKTIRKDDSNGWMWVRGEAVFDEDKKIIGLWGAAQDITERKLTEEALRKSEAIKNTMVSNIGDVIVIIDQSGINQYKSPNVTKLFGWRPEELIGKSYWDTVHPDDLEVVKKFIATIATEPNAAGTTEMQYKRKDGEYVWIEISVINLLHDKDIQGILGNYREITERKQAEQIRQQLDVSRKTALFKQNFLANMSHEIRTPLTGVLGMIDILHQTQLSEEQQDYLNIIKTSGENLSEIINQVLDYSKIEAGKVSLNPVVFQFSSLTRDTVNLYKNSLKSGVKLITQSDPQIPLIIEADRFRLSQVINNLVSNALKFTKEGSVSILSTLESVNTQTNEVVIKVEVADTGIGIPDSLQKKLFVPFSQIDAADVRKYEGTGLGLAICKQLIELMRGKIGLTSHEGKGSTFWFTFSASIAEQQPTPKAEYIGLPSQKNLRILLVEDKPVNQKVINLMLTSLGHKVTIATNGEQALDTFEPGKFNLILMDIQMPVMDGVTATQILRLKYNELPPIIGLSANAFEGDREKYMALGMDEYLTKPMKKNDFERIISRTIR